ncbi:MAG: tandem-95 repeat protein [Fibrobacter sp.]|nr:tandem-95 repeat protein [Fibrobacter sp.]
MMKKLAFASLGLISAMAMAAAPRDVVYSVLGETETIKLPYWFIYEYGKATADSSGTSKTAGRVVKVTGVSTSSTIKEYSGGGMGFGWMQEKSGTKYVDVPYDLSKYDGLCITYSATQKFRLELKQGSVTDDNNFGVVVPKQTSMDTLFVPFNDFAQEDWGEDLLDLDLTDQLGVQFSFKDKMGGTSNTIKVQQVVLGSSCTTYAPELLPGYTTPGAYELNEGDTLSFDLSKMFKDEDSEPTVSVRIEEGSSFLSLLSEASSFTLKDVVKFIPVANSSGKAKVTFAATDGAHPEVTFEATITVVDLENPPVALDDEYEVDEDDTLTVKFATGVLANDYDLDDGGNDNLTASVVTEPEHGTLKLTPATGAFVYVPEKDYFGTDTWTYKVTHEDGTESETATVTITVKPVADPPVVKVVDKDAFDVTLTLEEDFDPETVSPILIPKTAILFSDPDGAETLTIGALGTKVNAALTEDEDNYIITLSPVEDANGVADIILFATDGTDTVKSPEINFKITPVADDPKASADQYEVEAGDTLVVAADKGLLANDVNPDDATVELKAVLDSEPDDGEFTLKEDGSFTYVAGEEGKVMFTYHAETEDGAKSAETKVVITIKYKNLAPEIEKGVLEELTTAFAKLEEDFLKPVTYTATDMQGWFVDDLTKPAKLKYAASTEDSIVKVTLTKDGTLQVAAIKNACGETSFTVTATDEAGLATDLVVPVSVACVNDKPVLLAMPDTAEASLPDFELKIDMNKYVSDPEGDPLTFTFTPNDLTKNNVTYTEKDGILTIKPKEDAKLLKGQFLVFTVKAADKVGDVSFRICVKLTSGGAVAITPAIASKMGWQGVITQQKGSVALFDMQGRLMWTAKLPVNEGDVRAAASQVQGRKILQINKQVWTIR